MTTKYNDLYYIQNELNFLYKEVEKLKEEYQVLNIKTDKIYNFDEFDLHKDDLKIEELKDFVIETIKNVEKKKIELLKNNQQHLKQNLEKPNKKEIKEGKTKKEKSDKIDEFSKAKQIILKDIINKQKYLAKNIKKVNNPHTLLGYIGNFFKKFISLNFVLLPFGLFTNPLLFGLANSILINNSLKTMRKLANPKLDIKYDVLLDNYYDNKQIIMHTYNAYISSLNELNSLENEIVCYNPNDLMLKDIDIIRDNIEKEIKKIKEKNDIIDKIYIK